MKTSKRSLIASIAVLCVCALSLSTATFAWFTAAETAQVKDIILEVQAQSDIKISAVESATNNSQSDDWKTILEEKHFTGSNEIEQYISDVVPADFVKGGNYGTCTGNFKVPADRKAVVEATGAYDGELIDATEGWAEFKVWVKTTKEQDVKVNFGDFTYNGTGSVSAVNALKLGILENGAITEGNYNQVVIPKTSLQPTGDSEGFWGVATFYVWVDGDHADCVNKNALSLKEYKFSLSFSYAGE